MKTRARVGWFRGLEFFDEERWRGLTCFLRGWAGAVDVKGLERIRW